MADSRSQELSFNISNAENDLLRYFVPALQNGGRISYLADLSEPIQMTLNVTRNAQEGMQQKIWDIRLPIQVEFQQTQHHTAPLVLKIGGTIPDSVSGRPLPNKGITSDQFFIVLTEIKRYREARAEEGPQENKENFQSGELNYAIDQLSNETSKRFCYNRALKNEKLAVLTHLKNQIEGDNKPKNQREMDDLLIASLLFWREKNGGQDIILQGNWSGKKSWFGRNDYSSRTQNAFIELAGGKEAFDALLQKLPKPVLVAKPRR